MAEQVRFYFEAFRVLKLPMSIMHLHGKQKQLRRMGTYAAFCEAKRGTHLHPTFLPYGAAPAIA